MRKFSAKMFLALSLVLALPLAATAQVNITASTFPIWLLARQVVGDVPDVNLSLMIPATAGCPHDYVLTPQDMQRLGGTDILVVNGMGLDDFAVANAQNLANDQGRELKVVDSTEGLGMIMLQFTPEYDEHDHERDELGVNPHGFASPFIYRMMLDNVAQGLSRLNPAHDDAYRTNAEIYALRLDELGDRFLEFSDRVGQGIQVLTQHSGLDYLARDAGLQVAGHIQEHEGQEPSAAGLLALTALIRDKGVAVIFTEPQYSDKAARSLSDETGVPVQELDPVASGPADAGLDYYITVMSENLIKLENLFGQ